MADRHVASNSAVSPRAAVLMARMDGPFPWRKLRLAEICVLLVAVALVASIVMVQQRASDLAFREYALSAKDVTLSEILAHPAGYKGQRVHVSGITGDSVMTDAQNQVMLSDSTAGSGAGADDSSTGASRVLLLTTLTIAHAQPVDVWGVYEGPVTISGGAPGLSIPVIRADYVRASR